MRKPVGATQLDSRKLYEAMTSERQRRKMTLAEMAAELDVDISTIACWRRGGGINGDALLRLCIWMPITDLRAYARQLPPADPPADQGEAA